MDVSEECSICLGKLTKNIALLECCHKYHYKCINEWIYECKKKGFETNCPTCGLKLNISTIINETVDSESDSECENNDIICTDSEKNRRNSLNESETISLSETDSNIESISLSETDSNIESISLSETDSNIESIRLSETESNIESISLSETESSNEHFADSESEYNALGCNENNINLDNEIEINIDVDNIPLNQASKSILLKDNNYVNSSNYINNHYNHNLINSKRNKIKNCLIM
jgi:hypothetical protein